MVREDALAWAAVVGKCTGVLLSFVGIGGERLLSPFLSGDKGEMRCQQGQIVTYCSVRGG